MDFKIVNYFIFLNLMISNNKIMLSIFYLKTLFLDRKNREKIPLLLRTVAA